MKSAKQSAAKKKAGKKKAGRAAPSPQPQRVVDAMKAKKKMWTIMVYLGGDNNLAEEMVYALKSMYSIGSTSQYKIFAYFDTGLRPLTFPIPTREEQRGKANGNGGYAAAVGSTHVQPMYAKGAPAQSECQVTEDHELLKTAEALNKEREKKIANEVERPRHQPKKGKPVPILDEYVRSTSLRGAVVPLRQTLEEFIKSSICAAPAHRYMLVLSGHGSGAVGDFLSGRKRPSGVTIPGLRATLENVGDYFADTPEVYQKLDILGLDSCQMSTAEMAYEIRNYAKILVASEGFQPNTGWPYDRMLNHLNAAYETAPAEIFPSAEALAKGLVREHVEFYSSDYALADVSTDLSALDLEKLKGVADKLTTLSNLLIKAYEQENKWVQDAIVLAHWECQGYKAEQNVDLFDFCQCLGDRCERLRDGLAGEIKDACVEVCNNIEEGNDKLVLLSGYCGAQFQYSHGMSVYFPWTRWMDAAGVDDLRHYQSLSFALDTRWDEFLDIYTRKTQRPVRGGASEETHESSLNRRDWIFTGRPRGLRDGRFRIPRGELRLVDKGKFQCTIASAEVDKQTILTHNGMRGLLTVTGGDIEVMDRTVTVKNGAFAVEIGKETKRGKDGVFTITEGLFKFTGGEFDLFDKRYSIKDGEYTVKETFVVKDGEFTVKDGEFTVKDGEYTVKEFIAKDGEFTVKDGEFTVKDGAFVVDANKDGEFTVKDGEFTVKDGEFTVKDGEFTVKDGEFTVKDGEFTVKDGEFTVKGGAAGPTRIATMKNPPVCWNDAELLK